MNRVVGRLTSGEGENEDFEAEPATIIRILKAMAPAEDFSSGAVNTLMLLVREILVPPTVVDVLNSAVSCKFQML